MTNWYQSCSSSAMAEVPTLDSWRDRWQGLSLESQDFHRKMFRDLNEIRISMRMPLSDFSPDVAIEIVRLPREIPKEGDVSHVDEELKCFAKEILIFDQVWSQLSMDEKISWSRVSLGLSPSFDYSIQTTGKGEPEPNSTSAPMNNSGVNQSQSKDATSLNQSQRIGANQSQEMGVNQSRNAIGVNQTGIPPPSVLGTGPAEKAREFARTGPIPSPIPTVSAIIKAPGMCLLPSIETLQEANGALDYTDSEQEANGEGNSVENIEDRVKVAVACKVFDEMTKTKVQWNQLEAAADPNLEVKLNLETGVKDREMNWHTLGKPPEKNDVSCPITSKRSMIGIDFHRGNSDCLDKIEILHSRFGLIEKHQMVGFNSTGMSFLVIPYAHQVFEVMPTKGFHANGDTAQLEIACLLRGSPNLNFDPGGYLVNMDIWTLKIETSWRNFSRSVFGLDVKHAFQLLELLLSSLPTLGLSDFLDKGNLTQYLARVSDVLDVFDDSTIAILVVKPVWKIGRISSSSPKLVTWQLLTLVVITSFPFDREKSVCVLGSAEMQGAKKRQQWNPGGSCWFWRNPFPKPLSYLEEEIGVFDHDQFQFGSSTVEVWMGTCSIWDELIWIFDPGGYKVSVNVPVALLS